MLPPLASISIRIHPPFPSQAHIVPTSFGPLPVFVVGHREKPPLIAYPDIALHFESCFQGLLLCPETSSVLLEHFCIYHIDASGRTGESSVEQLLSVDDLADQVAEIVEFFGLEEVLCMGVTAGALSPRSDVKSSCHCRLKMKYKERVVGLILISPVCQAPSWTEWFCNKLMINLLHFYGMCGLVKEMLLRRYFSPDLRTGNSEGPDIVQSCRRMLDQGHSQKMIRFLQAIHMRKDISGSLRKLKCRTLMFVGEHSPFYQDAIRMRQEMDTKYNALIEVKACGSLVTEEIPDAMFIPIEYFLMGYGFYRPIQLASHNSANLPNAPCISAELLSPKNLGLNLKPIKTKTSSQD